MISIALEKTPLANVLVVDDRKTDIALTQIALEDVARLKCNLLIANTGVEALDLLQEYTKNGTSIDLILLDINMPEMDGFEMLEHMNRNESLKKIAVVMCTGSDYYKDQERAEELGVAGYIVKPIQFEKLKLILKTIPALYLDYEGEAGSLLRAG